jgi:phospholipase B1
MAVGDSITAAFSATSSVTEDRQLSWSIGEGSADQITLPWLLKQYSPKVEGQSHRAWIPKNIAHLPTGDYHGYEHDGLNVAESSGSAGRGSVDEQWRFLQENKHNVEDFDSRWKVLTYWMFANDVCGMCGGPAENQTDYHVWEQKTDEFLTNVSNSFTNTYVNLVSMIDLSNIHRIQQSKLGCKIEHGLVLEECGCIDRGTDEELAMLDRNVHYMNSRMHKFAADWRAKLAAQGRTDLAIVSQAGFEGIGPTLDSSFLSKLDCFHPSAQAHQSLAIGLWNSMLCTDDRVNRCGIVFTPDMPALCPNETTYFYTGPDVVPNPPLEAWSAQATVV